MRKTVFGGKGVMCKPGQVDLRGEWGGGGWGRMLSVGIRSELPNPAMTSPIDDRDPHICCHKPSPYIPSIHLGPLSSFTCTVRVVTSWSK